MKLIIISRFWLWAFTILTRRSLVAIITNPKRIIARINYFILLYTFRKAWSVFSFVSLKCLCMKKCSYSHRNRRFAASAQYNLDGICSQREWQKVSLACIIIFVILILSHGWSYLPSFFSDDYTIACLDQEDLRHICRSLKQHLLQQALTLFWFS